MLLRIWRIMSSCFGRIGRVEQSETQQGVTGGGVGFRSFHQIAKFPQKYLFAQPNLQELMVGWVSDSVTHRNVREWVVRSQIYGHVEAAMVSRNAPYEAIALVCQSAIATWVWFVCSTQPHIPLGESWISCVNPTYEAMRSHVVATRSVSLSLYTDRPMWPSLMLSAPGFRPMGKLY